MTGDPEALDSLLESMGLMALPARWVIAIQQRNNCSIHQMKERQFWRQEGLKSSLEITAAGSTGTTFMGQIISPNSEIDINYRVFY